MLQLVMISVVMIDILIRVIPMIGLIGREEIQSNILFSFFFASKVMEHVVPVK